MTVSRVELSEPNILSIVSLTVFLAFSTVSYISVKILAVSDKKSRISGSKFFMTSSPIYFADFNTFLAYDFADLPLALAVSFCSESKSSKSSKLYSSLIKNKSAHFL